MPTHELELAIVTRTLDDETHIAEALFFREVSRYGDDAERLKRTIAKNAAHIVENGPLLAIHSRTLASAIEQSTLTLHLDRGAKHSAWREPLELRLQVLHWRH